MRRPCAAQPTERRERFSAPFAAAEHVALALMLLAACSPGTDERAHPAARDVPRSISDGPLGAAQAPCPGAHCGSPTVLTDVHPQLARAPSVGVRDAGIFSDLDGRVQLALPFGLNSARIAAAVDNARHQLVLYDASRPIKVYPLGGSARLTVGTTALALRPNDRAELEPLLAPERLYVFDQRVELPPGDADDDGIPDPLDVWIGALKTALNADRYDGRYTAIAYPGGDVPREIGVCTDVVIRALRNAGYDLQRELQEDLRRAPRAYPMVRRPNSNIDHRRVKSLLPLFQRRYHAHSANPRDSTDPLEPGDIVFMDTFPDRAGTEHVGIVSDRIGEQGLPLVINNWTDGTVTKPMDLLSWVPVTHRFRLPDRIVDQGPIAAFKTQLITVVSENWRDSHAQLRRYTRLPGARWQPEGPAIPVVLGYAGYGWGDGLHGQGAPLEAAGSGRDSASRAVRERLAPPAKREGDGRSPAGAFELGLAYAYEQDPALRIRYRVAHDALRCVDDPGSSHYNRVLSANDVRADWNSAEKMRRDDDLYELAIEVSHNRAPIRRGHGSCIFVHVWAGPDTPVTGCTGMDKAALKMLAHWLVPNAPVLVALPAAEYRSLQRAWGLP